LKKIELHLNGFKIKEEHIPKRLFKFKLIFLEEDESNRIRIIKRDYKGVPITPVDKPEVEVVSLEKPNEIEFSTISLEEIPVKKQEQLVYSYLKWKLEIIKHLEKHLLSPQTVNSKDLLIIPSIKSFTVRKIGENFYFFFDIGYRVRSTKSIYDLAKEGKIQYEDLIGKKVIYDPFGNKLGKRSIVEILDIETSPSHELVERIGDILLQKYGIPKTTDSNIPVLYVSFKSGKSNKYPTFPFCCFLESKEHLAQLHISNEKRKEILKRLASKVPFIESILLQREGSYFNAPQYLVKTKDEKVLKVNSLKDTIKYPAWFTPSILTNKEVPVLVFVDEELPRQEVENFIKSQVQRGFLKLRRQGNKVQFKTIKSSEKSFSFQINHKDLEIPQSVLTEVKNYPFGFALCVVKKLSEEEYDEVKRKLFINNIVSQVVIYDKWKKSPEHISQTLVMNIYSKLGLRFFSLAQRLPYDLIVGIDVGNDRFNRRSKAGGITVLSSEGVIETMFPLSIDTGGEKIKFLGELFEILVEKVNAKDKSILVLRDGYLHQDEVESVISKKSLIKRIKRIDFVNVKKNHSLRILSDSGSKAVVLNENCGVILPHSFKGARSLLVDSAFTIQKGVSIELCKSYHTSSLSPKISES